MMGHNKQKHNGKLYNIYAFIEITINDNSTIIVTSI